MYNILEKKVLNQNTLLMKVHAPLIANVALAGQFVILRVSEDGERIPLTIADFDKKEGSVTIIFQKVGATTNYLATLNVGDKITNFAGPLGQPSNLEGLNRVLCIGGGVGTAVIYPMIKQLKKQGTSVDVIIGARSQAYVILEKEIQGLTNQLFVTTDDGSYGKKGFVTDQLKILLDQGERYDEVIVVGPLVMMKYVSMTTKNYSIKTTVSMNPIMVDGTGMCGGCRVEVGGKTKYACVDGPDFNGHEVNFDTAMNRAFTYKEQELKATHHCRGGLHG